MSCDHLSTTTLNDRESREVDWIGSTGGPWADGLSTREPGQRMDVAVNHVHSISNRPQAREKGSLSKEVAFLEKLKQE